MKKVSLVFLLFLNVLSYSQSIEYAPVFIDLCDGKNNANWWYIIDSNSNKIEPHSGKVTLDPTKNYYLICAALKSEPTALNLGSNSKLLDTIYVPQLTVTYPENFFTWNPTYLACDSLINGAYTEYFKNGNLRYKGVLENGKVKDTLRSFFRTGELKSISIISGKHVMFKEYFKNGQIRTDVDTKQKYRFYYYASGSLKSKMHNSKNHLTDYFENGDVQAVVNSKEEKIYSLKGNLIGKLSRTKFLFKDKIRLNKDKITYSYNWKTYDTLGIKKRVVFFETKNFYSLYNRSVFRYPKKEYSVIDYYKNGQRVYTISIDYCLDENNKDYTCWTLYTWDGKEITSEKHFPFDRIEKLIETYDEKLQVTY